MEVKFCRDCQWSFLEDNQHYSPIRCSNPIVVRNEPYTLASKEIKGPVCYEERNNRGHFFVACGIRGKLFMRKVL